MASGVRDGRRKAAPHGAIVPSLPVVPGWKAMAAGGTGRVEKRKRARRRPPKGGVVAEGDGGQGRGRDDGLAGGGGTTWGGGNFDRSLGARNSAADLERLSARTSGQDGDGTGISRMETSVEKSTGNAHQQTAREGRGGVGQGRHQTEQEVADIDGVDSGRERTPQLAEGESLSMETLDSAFPIPGDGCDSGGGEGLGDTISPERPGLLSPGWSSRSSRRSSEAGETSSGFMSDSAAIREGQALLSGEVVIRAGGYTRSAGGGADGSAVAGSRVEEDGRGRLENVSSSEVEGGRAPLESTPAVTDDRAVSPGVIVHLSLSAAFPDSISDMSDNRTFIEQHQRHRQPQDEEDYGEGERGLIARSRSSSSGRGSDHEETSEIGLGTGAESTDFLAGGRLHTADQDWIGEGGGAVSDQILTPSP